MGKENIHGSKHTNFALLIINYWFAYSHNLDSSFPPLTFFTSTMVSFNIFMSLICNRGRQIWDLLIKLQVI